MHFIPELGKNYCVNYVNSYQESSSAIFTLIDCGFFAHSSSTLKKFSFVFVDPLLDPSFWEDADKHLIAACDVMNMDLVNDAQHIKD